MLHDLDIQAEPLDFVMAISETSPSYAAQLCNLLIDQGPNPVSFYFAWLLLEIRKVDVPLAIDLQRRAIASGNQVLNFSQTRVYHWSIWSDTLQPEDLQIVSALLDYPDPSVSHAAISLLRNIGQVQSAFAIQAALTIELGDDLNRAHELYALFDNRFGINMSVLNREQRGLLLDKMIPLKNISDHVLGQFLQILSSMTTQSQARRAHNIPDSA